MEEGEEDMGRDVGLGAEGGDVMMVSWDVLSDMVSISVGGCLVPIHDNRLERL